MLEKLFIYSSLLPLIIYFAFRPKQQSYNILLVLVYCFSNFLAEILTSYFLKHDIRWARLTVFYSFTFLELFIFFLFIRNIINSKLLKKACSLLTLITVLFIIYRLISLDVIKKDSIAVGFQHITIILFTVFYLYDQVTNIDIGSSNTPLFMKFEFWIITGTLIYMTGTFFLFILSNNLSLEQRAHYWNLVYISNIVKNLFFCIAIYIAARKHTKPKLT